MEWLKIDDVAQSTGLTKRTIRYYEQIGLLNQPQRSEGGMRLYTKGDVERLNNLIRARDVLGFSLQELKRYLELQEIVEICRKGCKTAAEKKELQQVLIEMKERLHEQIVMLNEKLEKMQDFKREMEALHEKIESYLYKNDER